MPDTTTSPWAGTISNGAISKGAARSDPGQVTCTRWTAWQLHLGSPARDLHDRVVTDVVVPVVRETAGRPWFFVRYWQGGPHVRLRMADLDAEQAADVEDALAGRLTDVGRLRPGEQPLDPDGYRADAARLAAGETGADRVVQALRAPGVHPGGYAPEDDRYGGARHLPVSERLFQLSSVLVAGFLGHRPSPAARAALAVAATSAAAEALPTPAGRALFCRLGLHATREVVRGLGATSVQLERWCQVGAPPGAAVPRTPTIEGPLAPWRDGLERLVATLATAPAGTTTAPVGAVLGAHVHMLHNRLGLGAVEEMRTYAWLHAAHGGAW